MKAVLLDEIFDNLETVCSKVRHLRNLLLKSKNPLIFTGAGISTFAGIADYRSSYKTSLKTGPGLWETAENREKFQGNPVIKPAIECFPTRTHMIIKTLLAKKLISHIITQNVDNLHLRSGVPEEKLIELHGNICKEFCESCSKTFYRDFYVKPPKTSSSEEVFTKRSCGNCGNKLRKTLVNFGEKIQKEKIVKAFEWIHESDLCICVGSSLKVNPASRIPREFSANPDKHLVIINLQSTYFEKLAKLNIYGYCDQIFENFAQELGISSEIEEFAVRKSLVFQFFMEDSAIKMRVVGKIPGDLSKNFTIIQEIDVKSENSHDFFRKYSEEDDYEFIFPKNIEKVRVCVKFFGNFLEPNAEFLFDLMEISKKPTKIFAYEMVLDDFLREWSKKVIELEALSC